MVATPKDHCSPAQLAAAVDRLGQPSRNSNGRLRGLPRRVGLVRGVRPHASDWLSRLERRATYLPGV
jgi:hypothetical protein